MYRILSAALTHNDPTLAFTCEYDVWIASSYQEEVDVDVAVKFISIRSGEAVSEAIAIKTLAKPNGTTEVIRDQRVKTSGDLSWEKQDPFIIHAIVAVDGQVVATDTDWPRPFGYLDFSNRNVRVELSPAKDQATVSADLPVKSFMLEEWEGLNLSDNGVDLIPGEKHVITISGDSAKTEDLRWTYVGA
ncbi:hypothetical protein MRS44_007045 [Fusarium solani]|uniref:uncharacterized protein n=1 Tax=Fusarium solani TaxID=169388 RepID=UPI0032C402C1|nr:hypothetical protein MRS44_007045 [Fusarium solani]